MRCPFHSDFLIGLLFSQTLSFLLASPPFSSSPPRPFSLSFLLPFFLPLPRFLTPLLLPSSSLHPSEENDMVSSKRVLEFWNLAGKEK